MLCIVCLIMVSEARILPEVLERASCPVGDCVSEQLHPRWRCVLISDLLKPAMLTCWTVFYPLSSCEFSYSNARLFVVAHLPP